MPDHPVPLDSPFHVPWEPLGEIDPTDLPEPSDLYPGPWTAQGRGNGHYDISDAQGRRFAHVYIWDAAEDALLVEAIRKSRIGHPNPEVPPKPPRTPEQIEALAAAIARGKSVLLPLSEVTDSAELARRARLAGYIIGPEVTPGAVRVELVEVEVTPFEAPASSEKEPTLGMPLPAWLLGLPLSPLGELIRSEISDPGEAFLRAAERLTEQTTSPASAAPAEDPGEGLTPREGGGHAASPSAVSPVDTYVLPHDRSPR